jgi:hypothetical protein
MPVRVEIKSIRSRFFIPQVQDRINRRARQNARNTGEQVLDDVRDNITQSHSPPASRPGQFPHTATGDLAKSGKVEQLNEGTGAWVAVVFGAGYAAYVEESRPFLSRTLRQNRKKYAGSLIRRLFAQFGN